MAKDREAVQGKWVRVSGSVFGRDSRGVKEVVGDTETVAFTYGSTGEVVRSHKNKFALTADGPVRVWTYSDMEVTGGPIKGQMRSGPVGSFVYRLRDDGVLEEVGGLLPRPGGQMPAYLALWVRAEVADRFKPGDPAAGAALKDFQGTWAVESGQSNGMTAPADFVKRLTVTIAGDRYTMRQGKTLIQAGVGRGDGSKSPKQIDLFMTEGEDQGAVLRGVYEADGDTARACFSVGNKKRPTAVKAGLLSGNYMYVLKRVKN